MLNLILFLILSSCSANCEYKPSEPIDREGYIQEVVSLSSKVSEPSGIVFFDSRVWTFNDSGNKPILYSFDIEKKSLSGSLLIKGARNIDWEDIAQSDSLLFIGDFGNNAGNRKDLSIYIIPKDSIRNSDDTIEYFEKISFEYEDQDDFGRQLYSTAFDCEAMIYRDDSLYLFTKDWVEETTTVYSLPATPGMYKAKKQATFNCDGLITGADYDADNRLLVLCGYSQYVPFIIQFAPSENLSLHQIPFSRTDFFDELGMQVEGISLFEKQIYLCSENSSREAGIYKADFK